MKRYNAIFMAMAAIAALAFASCNKAEIASSSDSELNVPSVVVKANVPENITKTAFNVEDGNYYVTWQDGDKDKVALLFNGTLYQSSAVSISTDKKSAEFTFEGIESLTGDYQLFYPFAAASYAEGKVTMTLPQSQGSSKTTPHAAATIMMAEGSGTNPVTFRHLAAYAKMTVMGLPAGEKVDNVQLYKWHATFNGGIVYNVADGSVDYMPTDYKESLYIWFMGDGDKTVKEDGTLDVWFALKPMTLGKNASLQVKTKIVNSTQYQVDLKTAKEVKFEAGGITAFPVYSTAYKISFNTHGGSAIGDQYIQKGNKIRPVKTSIYPQGLYEGAISNLEEGLEGWFKDEGYTQPFDIANDIPEGDMTLHAKWSIEPPVPVKTTLKDAFAYVSEQTGTDYTYVMTADQEVGAASLTLKTNANAVLKIVGTFTEKKIKQTWGNCVVFNVSAGKVILGENVTLNGTQFQKASAVTVTGGQFFMEKGSKIEGTVHDATSENGDCRGVVHITTNGSSMFTMNGGEICNCNVTVASTQGYFSGIVSINQGKFVMNGGKIHDNKISAAHTVVLGGGVAMSPSRQFTKTGGEIYDNTAVNTAETDGKFIGQQAVIGSKSNLWWVYKIDDNIGISLNFDVSNIGETNPAPEPWIRIPRN